MTQNASMMMLHSLILCFLLQESVYSFHTTPKLYSYSRKKIIRLKAQERFPETSALKHHFVQNRREVIVKSIPSLCLLSVVTAQPQNSNASSRAKDTATTTYPQIDVNNAVAREFTAFPGLYPTIATKIVNGAKKKPFQKKSDIYAILDSDAERDRLKQYDSSLKITAPDSAVKQFKSSQICKYECGSRVSNSYRDEQIKSVQAGRSGMD